ncbi:hypothetical protein ES705_18232 [subsurface metagenome]
MIWYPTLNDLKSYYRYLKTKYTNLEDEHNLVGHHISVDKEQDLEGILDALQYGLPMTPLDLFQKAVLFLRDLVSSHACSEGNHRFAYLSAESFLEENGYLLKLRKRKAVKFTKKVGKNPTFSFKSLKSRAKWLKSKCKKYEIYK